MAMDDLTARTLPHSLEAEQSVLGAMLIDGRCVSDVVGMLRPDDFYLKQNRDIYETIFLMFNAAEPVDAVTVLNKMKEQGVADERTGDYLVQLIDVTPTAAFAKKYAEIVHDKALLRSLAEASNDILSAVYEGVGTTSEQIERAEKMIYGIRKGETGDSLRRIGEVIVDMYGRLNELAQSDQAFPGLSTGLIDLDRMINGLNPSDLTLIAARPGMGKTSLALNIAQNVAKKYSDKAVAVFSLEMSSVQLVTRLVSSECFIDNKKLMTGNLSDDDWVNIGKATNVLSKTDLRIDDNPAITVAEINAKCRRIDNLGLIIIDYLQLMTQSGYGGNRGDNRVNIVADITRALKIMAKELNVPVLCLSQLNRGSESRQDKRPLLSDLRESGTIEQDADCVLLLYRDDYYNENSEEKNVAECIVAKNRHGETGTVKLQWIPQYTTFANREWQHDE